jgi:hypothetical protein
MMDDLDVYRAELLIQQHGASAGAVALKQCEQLFDVTAAAMWRQIRQAIGELQRGRREGGGA